jgi:hypothetical protein
MLLEANDGQGGVQSIQFCDLCLPSILTAFVPK